MGNDVDGPCTFEQTDAILTGTCLGQEATGEVTGMTAKFEYTLEVGGMPLDFAYSGTVADGGQEIAGELTVFGFAAKFSATKQ